MLPELQQDDPGLELFLLESWESMAEIDRCLDRPLDASSAERAAVFAHRLKGSAGLQDLGALATAASDFELILAASQRRGAEFAEDSLPDLRHAFDKVLRCLSALLVDQASASPLAPAPVPVEPAEVPAPVQEDGPVVRQLREFLDTQKEALTYFRPEVEELLEEISSQFGRGAEGADVHRLFRAFHTMKGSAFIVGCEPLGNLAHLAEDHLAEARESADARPDLELLQKVYSLAEAMLWMDERGSQGIDSDFQTLRDSLAPAPASEELPTAVEAPPEPPAEPAPRPVLPAAPRRIARAKSSGISTLRAEVARIDSIINGLGDISSQRARLEQSIDRIADVRRQVEVGQRRLSRLAAAFERRVEALAQHDAGAAASDFGVGEFEAEDDLGLLSRQIVEISSDLKEMGDSLELEITGLRTRYSRLQKTTAGLRSEMGRLRMLPMSRVFARLERSFQSARGDKSVRFEAVGESAEVDSAVFETVFEALDHVLRNAVAHGIEAPEARTAQGKDAEGTVTVRALQSRTSLTLEISDDGAGLDLEKVAAKAVSLGLASREDVDRMPVDRRWELILLPGLSTQDVVDSRAGRGVGMDVVANRVRRVGGELSVRTERGKGTTFVFELPLTLVVSDVLVAEASGRRFAVPARRVKKVLPCIRPENATETGRAMDIDGEKFALSALEGLLGLDRVAPEASGGALIWLSTSRGEGLVEVDRVLGIEEVVLRNLGDFLDPLQHLQGGFQADDGEVVLVLNAEGLLLLTERTARVAQTETAGLTKALLVDDSVSVRRVVGEQLRGYGLAVETAQDGTEALTLMESHRFDLLFTDLEMPNMHGYELIERVRARDTSIPIVVMTTRVSDKHREAADRLGANVVLAKPVPQDQLRQAALLRRSDGR